MKKEKTITQYICDECQCEINNYSDKQIIIDAGSTNDVAKRFVIDINFYMSYNNNDFHFCDRCILKILNKAINQIQAKINSNKNIFTKQ